MGLVRVPVEPHLWSRLGTRLSRTPLVCRLQWRAVLRRFHLVWWMVPSCHEAVLRCWFSVRWSWWCRLRHQRLVLIDLPISLSLSLCACVCECGGNFDLCHRCPAARSSSCAAHQLAGYCKGCGPLASLVRGSLT